MHTKRISHLARIVMQATDGVLVFPTSVNAVLRLQQGLADPDCHIDQVARLLLAEPVLAARAVALANSSVFARNHAQMVTGVKAAVGRLGYRNLYSLATAMVVRQFGNSIRDPGLRAQARQLWEHTAHVAALAHAIAARVTRVDADTAMFAGIVHQAGGFYLLSQADQSPGLLDELFDLMAPSLEIITRALMKKLHIPEPVSDAIVALPGSMVSLPPAGLRDTLLIARHLAPVASPLQYGWDAAPAGDALQAYLEQNQGLQALLDEAAREAQSLSVLLLA